ncbi:MAG: hypothetical protein AB9891_04645 [Anaerolineaceae bacterium]
MQQSFLIPLVFSPGIGGAACLSQFGVLFVGLLLVFYIQALLNQTPLQTTDFVVILIMSLLILIPSVLFFTGLEKIGKIKPLHKK